MSVAVNFQFAGFLLMHSSLHLLFRCHILCCTRFPLNVTTHSIVSQNTLAIFFHVNKNVCFPCHLLSFFFSFTDLSVKYVPWLLLTFMWLQFLWLVFLFCRASCGYLWCCVFICFYSLSSSAREGFIIQLCHVFFLLVVLNAYKPVKENLRQLSESFALVFIIRCLLLLLLLL